MEIASKIRNVLKLIVGQGHVVDVDDSKSIQHLTCELMEGRVEIPRLQNYGISTSLPRGSHILAICSGQRKDLVGICAQAKERPTGLKPGEVVLHNEIIELRLTGDTANFTTKRVSIDGVEILKVMTDLVDYLVEQAPLAPEARFKNSSPLVQLQKALKGGAHGN